MIVSKFRQVSIVVISLLIGATATLAAMPDEKAEKTFAAAARQGYYLGCMEALKMVDVPGMLRMYKATCKNNSIQLEQEILNNLKGSR